MLLTVLELGYLLALQMPHGRVRDANQQTLALMRDMIARARGQESEDVQNEFEGRAQELSEKLNTGLESDECRIAQIRKILDGQ
jgi:nucleoside 2-deoxyribosyltransferase